MLAFMAGMAIGYIAIQILNRLEIVCKYAAFWSITIYKAAKGAIREWMQTKHK